MDDQFGKRQNLPPRVQEMLDGSPVIAPNDVGGTGYVVHATIKEHHAMSQLKEKWDKMTTEEVMAQVEKILDKDRARVFAKAFLERRPIRLTVNQDPRKSKLMELKRRIRRERNKRRRIRKRRKL